MYINTYTERDRETGFSFAEGAKKGKRNRERERARNRDRERLVVKAVLRAEDLPTGENRRF